MINIKMLKATLAGLILSLSGYASAGIITFNDRITFENYLSSFQTDGFDNFVTGTTQISLVRNDFTINSSNTTYQADENYCNGYNDSLSFTCNNDYLWNYATSSSSTILLNNSFNAIGFDFTQVHYSSTIQNLNVIYEGVTYLNTAASEQWGFFGIVDTSKDIASLQFNHNPTYMGMDNVTTGAYSQVPEPSTLAIFALGIIGLASRRFKKQ
ncbi:PEP-CTERM sorting domain-containing protein [Colwellia sp. 1_MG-2023]|uniref:PEP-CTERM sorting domain-containing protein n=1 Tax=Colwellia sp. 1_MG-2023 TaxID=3062649 RepID=UPI0026E43B92|nr:PEP-CTERM sorting domain-containing protein [Colwellia sp. 1_MG-2023]MDO6446499.1 PEP-CTERM sorting domain-containing protein [Colwellia sp. 1_MG-2023]